MRPSPERVTPWVPPMLPCGDLAKLEPGWAAEPKVPGLRAQVSVLDGEVTVRSSQGQPITVVGLEHLGAVDRPAVFDGMLVASGAAGNQAALQRALITRTPVAFAAFDLLWVDGDDICPAPYVQRRALLASALSGVPAGATLVPSWDVTSLERLHELKTSVVMVGLDGLVVKRRTSPYLPGRNSSAWRAWQPE